MTVRRVFRDPGGGDPHHLGVGPSARPASLSLPNLELVRRILCAHRQTGGATFRVISGENLAGSKRYAVSLFPEREQRISASLTVSHVSRYIRTNADLLTRPPLAFGAWTHAGETVLDVVLTHPSLQLVSQLGRLTGQKMVADLSRIDPAGHSRATGSMIDVCVDGGQVYPAHRLSHDPPSSQPRLQER